MKNIITLFLVYSISFSQVDYDNEIQPIFNATCTECHWTGGGYTGSGLELTSYNALMEGGNSGDVIANGLLEEYITTGSMPPYGATNFLTSEEIELISLWISEGANPSEGDDVVGCMDMTACNYTDEATEDDGSCAFPGGPCELDNGTMGVYNDLCECIEDNSSINEYNNYKTLVKIVDVLSRDIDKENKDALLLYIYDDGSVQKKYIVE